MRRQLDEKQSVRINGREQHIRLRELVSRQTIMAAVGGKDRDARRYVLSESQRLFADRAADSGAMPSPASLTASDALSIEEFVEDLRSEIRAEIEAEIARKATGDGR